MKSDDVAGSRACQVSQYAKRELIERSLLRDRMIASGKERRGHGPPAHDQIHQHSDRRLIKKPASHREKEFLGPTRVAKQHRRYGIHIEERTVIRDEQQRAFACSSFDVLEAVNVHDVVSGKMDPTGAEGALTPRPEALPGAPIHAPHETKRGTFERGWDFEITQSRSILPVDGGQ